MSSVYIAECDGSGIVELLVKKVKEMVTAGINYSV